MRTKFKNFWSFEWHNLIKMQIKTENNKKYGMILKVLPRTSTKSYLIG